MFGNHRDISLMFFSIVSLSAHEISSFFLSLIVKVLPLFFQTANGSLCQSVFKTWAFSFKRLRNVFSHQHLFKDLFEILSRCLVMASLSFSQAIHNSFLWRLRFLHNKLIISMVFSFFFSKKTKKKSQVQEQLKDNSSWTIKSSIFSLNENNITVTSLLHINVVFHW